MASAALVAVTMQVPVEVAVNVDPDSLKSPTTVDVGARVPWNGCVPTGAAFNAASIQALLNLAGQTPALGVDDVYSIIESGAAQGVIIKDGAWFSYNGERDQGREKLRTFLMANPKLLAEVREKVIQSIMNDAPVALSDEELSEEDAIEQSVAAMFDDDGEEAERQQRAQVRADRQIEYTDEDPWIRQKFAEECAKRGHASKMPEEVYRNRDYQWAYGDEKE